MSYGIKVEVWGDYALFTRPEMKVERMSYDGITPSAARGLIEAIYWHPGLRYQIDRIHVLNRIRFANIRRNEIKSKASSNTMLTAATKGTPLPHLYASNERVQRAALVLKDVRYVIEAHFDMTDRAAPSDNPGKFCDIIRRRLAKGRCYNQPVFGVREFPAYFKPYEAAAPPQGFYSNEPERDLGICLYDMDYSDPENIMPQFYRPIMRYGVIDVAGSEVYR